MIRLTRLAEPPILKEKAGHWTEQFIASGKTRPDSKRYGHHQVVEVLRATSHGKCFYCERAVSEGDGEVDHHVEVAERPEGAYEWANLYWACKGCNDKLFEQTVPRTTCLDPCDPRIDPADHLTFTSEMIFARAGSERGGQTIRKYTLNRLDLQLARSRALQQLFLLLSQNRVAPTDPSGREIVEAFADPTRPFSAMVRCYLQQV